LNAQLLKYFVCAAMLLVGNWCHATSYSQDSSYVRSMRNQLALRIYNVVKTTDFKLKNIDKRQTLRFNPNNGIGFGLGFSYKWMALDLGFIVPGTWRYNGKDDTKFDFMGTLFSQKHLVDFNVQLYEGYYLRNSNDFFPENDVPPVSGLRTDIGSVDLSLSYLYVLNNKKLSLQSSFFGDMIQKKSAGSITMHGFVSLYGVWADSALVQNDFGNSLNEQAYIDQMAALSFGTGIGYAQTVVLPKNFFITLSLAPLLMLTSSYAEVNHPDYENMSNNRFNFRLFTRNAIGYNAERFYLILNVTYDSFSVNLNNNTTLNYSPTKLKFFFGYRLAPKKR
jgi:hypothetical protein